MNERELHLAELKNDLEIATAKVHSIEAEIEEVESKIANSGEHKERYEEILDYLTKIPHGQMISRSLVLLYAQGQRVFTQHPILKDITLYIDIMAWGEDLQFNVGLDTSEHKKFDDILTVNSYDWTLDHLPDVAKAFDIPDYTKANSILVKLNEMLEDLPLDDKQHKTIQKLVIKKRK